MTIDEILDGFTCLDADLLDEYLTQKAANRQRLARRQVMHKRMLTCAACFMLVAAVTLSAVYHVQYPAIPLENAVGDVSARYVPGWMVEGQKRPRTPDISETELFENTDYVFTGTVESIQSIELDFNGQKINRSLITISTDNTYKGDSINSIRVITPPIGTKKHSDIMLHRIQEGNYGIFLVEMITAEDVLVYNNCSLNLSSFCDAAISDCYGFAFIKSDENNIICYDNIHDHPNKLFSSLSTYDWNHAIDYVTKMLQK